eukprot:m.73063 g.73063  ORF g.73063 m.73063 type:complete len:72 (+) comp14304_c0_seq1:3544-3759(+)
MLGSGLVGMEDSSESTTALNVCSLLAEACATTGTPSGPGVVWGSALCPPFGWRFNIANHLNQWYNRNNSGF